MTKTTERQPDEQPKEARTRRDRPTAKAPGTRNVPMFVFTDFAAI